MARELDPRGFPKLTLVGDAMCIVGVPCERPIDVTGELGCFCKFKEIKMVNEAV